MPGALGSVGAPVACTAPQSTPGSPPAPSPANSPRAAPPAVASPPPPRAEVTSQEDAPARQLDWGSIEDEDGALVQPAAAVGKVEDGQGQIQLVVVGPGISAPASVRETGVASDAFIAPVNEVFQRKHADVAHEQLTMDANKGWRTTTKKAYAVAIASQVILASSIMISKAAFDRGLSTFVYVFYRLAAASLFLLPLAIFLERRSAPPLSFGLLAKIFLYALVGNTLGMSLYNGSLKYTSATVASAMSNSIPVITFFLSVLMRMEVLNLKRSSGIGKAAGIALCLAGVLVIALYAGSSLGPLNHKHHGDSKQQATEHVSKVLWITGTFLMLLSSVAWSLWIVFQGLLLREYPNKLLATLIQCVFGTVQSCLVAVAIERDPSRWKLGLDLSLLAVAYSGIVGTGVGFYLQTWCVDMRGPVFPAMWNPLTLLFTVLCSSLLGKTTHLGSILGGILLVGGLYCVLWGKNKEETTHATMASDLEEQGSREQGDADAAISCTSTAAK